MGSHYHLPADVGDSVEADVVPLKAPDKADLISGAIGELSQFHGLYGYYAHGLPPSACTLPIGWDKRLVPLKNEGTSGITGLCLDPTDLTCAKLVAGREKDINFNTALIYHKLVDEHDVSKRIESLPDEASRAQARQSLKVVQARLAGYQPPTEGPSI